MSQRVWLLFSLVLVLGASFAGCLADEDTPDTDGGDGGDGSSDGGDGGTGSGSGTTGGTGTGGGGASGASGAIPVARFTFAPETELAAGSNITFNASASEDPDGTNLTFAWDFGDGATGEGMEVVHVYDAAGNYTVVLNVTDADGASAETNETLAIVAGGPSEFSESVSASITAPHPALLATSTGSDKSTYETRGAAKGTTYQLHEFTGVPTDGTSLTFTVASSTDYVQFVVFDGDGAQLGKNDFPTGKDEVVIEDEYAQGGHYFVFVFSAVNPNAAYDLTVTLA